ncbi:tyrosine-protein kinase fyna, partial [Biomphalaria glabrata]
MEKSLAEDWFQFIFKELQNLPELFSSCNDIEMKNSLGQLKRNLIIILLGIVRHVTSGKEYFSADHWKKLLQELRDDKDKFVTDLSLFVQVYIYGDRKILKFLKEKQKNIKDIVQGLQDFSKFFSTYNTPSHLAHVELHTYIDGLARLASIEQFAEL